MVAVKALVSTYAEKMTLYSPASSTPSSPDESSPSLGEQGAENWLKTINDWSPPDPLFNWKEVTSALEDAVIGIARDRYAKWHGTLPKRPLTTPPDSDDDFGSIGTRVATRCSSRRSVSRKRAHIGG
jgi:hypothetical protein